MRISGTAAQGKVVWPSAVRTTERNEWELQADSHMPIEYGIVCEDWLPLLNSWSSWLSIGTEARGRAGVSGRRWLVKQLRGWRRQEKGRVERTGLIYSCAKLPLLNLTWTSLYGTYQLSLSEFAICPHHTVVISKDTHTACSGSRRGLWYMHNGESVTQEFRGKKNNRLTGNLNFGSSSLEV